MEHIQYAESFASEWEHIFRVLVTRVAPEKNRFTLSRNVEVCGDCVCVYGPSRTDAEDDLKWLSEASKLPAGQRPKKFLVIDPSLLTTEQLAQAKRIWPDRLRKKGRKRKLRADIEIWDAKQVQERIIQIPPLALRYLPDEIEDGAARLERIKANRTVYDRELRKLHGKIQFIGMSVYKAEATGAVDMEAIYIPLRLVGEAADQAKPDTLRINPLRLLAQGERHVILGNPGSGKSTLLRFLALVGTHRPLQERYNSVADERLPIIVTLRQFEDALRADPDLDLLDYVVKTTALELGIRDLDREFFDYYLYAGQAILLIDGIDELPGLSSKQAVRQRIEKCLSRYPGNTTIVTSRIVGYDNEIRYEELGFSHHRVARLTLDNIDRFVGSWYKVRIENRAERKRNVNDLVRIVRDPSSRAIRELAENPLLLTIICLVHRVDAVLPDERVVLYHKCTETLLNTWHTWRFRTKDTRSRSRVARQNQARMEFIAYSMHGALDKTDPSKRAIVAHDDLVQILVEYIVEIERPRGGEPHALAERFLQFVRERAGLLIEVGEGQYSFVHLTFQEYLAALHLKNSGEVGGVEVIWKNFIKDRCSNPRWHEVIRLLIGSLKQDESQRYFLERIVPRRDEKDAPERAVLAGGCLLDSIAAAEDLGDEIVWALLLVAARADSLDALRKPLHQLQALQERENVYKEYIAKHVCSLSEGQLKEELTLGLTLSLVALGWTDNEIQSCHISAPEDTTRAARLFTVLLAEEPTADVALSAEEHRLLRAAQRDMSFSPPGGSFIASVLSLVRPGNSLGCEYPLFEQLLSTLVARPSAFEYQVIFAIMIGLDNPTKRTILSPALDPTRPLDRTRVLDLDWVRGRALDRTRDFDRILHRILHRNVHWALTRAVTNQSASIWPDVEAMPELHGPVLDLVCDLFRLEPRAHWWEALRVRSLHRVPERITLVNLAIWQQTLQAFRDSTPSNTDCRHAASQLLFDIWLYEFKCINSKAESPFAKLAERTRQHPSVYLQVAHCLRDLAYGEEARKDDLAAMLNSSDHEFQQLFRDALWRD